MNDLRLCLVLSVLSFANDGAVAQSSVGPGVSAVATPAEVTERSWTLLVSTVAETKHVDSATQALAALGTMGTNPRAAQLITTALKDPERDVRTAAILAAAQTKNPRLISAVRATLDDPEPQVAFTAATALWKIHDKSGEDILEAVVNGERKANAGVMNNARHSASRLGHNPVAMAKLGALQGAAILLGPFGFGIGAIEYARKNGAESGRASAVELLAEQHTQETHGILIDALDDKDPSVRAAAAEALGKWNDAATAKALEPLIDDAKLPVRLMASAAYINASGSHSAATQPKTQGR